MECNCLGFIIIIIIIVIIIIVIVILCLFVTLIQYYIFRIRHLYALFSKLNCTRNYYWKRFRLNGLAAL